MYVAALPWYDFAELRPATDAWWSGIAGHLRRFGVDGVPEQLTRDDTHAESWRRPELLLSQACGYDVLYDAADDIVPIATPCYAAEGCEGPRYRSYVVVRADRPWRTVDELRGRVVAVNEASSHSGNNAMRPHIAPLQVDGVFFRDVLVTGSHRQSLLALETGDVEVACVDAVVLALLRRVLPDAVRGLRKITCTQPALAPPLVTSRHTPPELRSTLQQALTAAMRETRLQPVREALLLRDLAFYPPAAYAELEDFEAPALAVGYRQLPAPARSPRGGDPPVTG
jgi:ABC-type phosphate/phosphonate transport system substrate-binding protein